MISLRATMSLDFEHAVEISRPAEVVFAFIADFENGPQWQKGMRSCRWQGARGPYEGASYRQEARFLGRSIYTKFRVTEYLPGQKISIESIESTFPIQVTRTVEALAEGCRVVAHVRGQPKGLFKVFSALVPRSVAQDYARLKALVESR